MFEKSLQDLVKGIRAANNDSAAYVAKAIQEIKDELKSRDVTIKAQALQKLTYLNMMGHDMSWAAFHVIEVMSQERFGLKRVGSLAASLTFTPTTDVLVLCNQLLKKEFSAKTAYEVGVAISTLANIATPELAENLLGDVVSMLTSSRPYIRKKATLVLYKIYLQYPAGLRLTFDHLKRRLSDDNPAIISCAINVICELARKKPSNYLSLAPELFGLLTNSSNNWMLIKIAKLMSALVAEEPRLARKLLEPLANIVQNTPAKSLMYECISTITFALQHTKKSDGSDAKNAPAVVRLCTDRLREFVRDPDQNLKYLGLVGLVQLMKSNPRVVAEHRELVLQCLTDEDVTIRLRALELISGMVTRRNLPDIVKSLLGHLETAEGHYRDELIAKIIFMCSRDKYGYLADFSWYIGVLAKLSFIQGTKHSATIAGQLLDVAVRVEDVRPFAVQTLLPMLADETLFQNARADNLIGGAAAAAASASGSAADADADGSAAALAIAEGSAVATFSSGRAGAGQVLYAAAWVVGEYCAIIPAPMHGKVVDALLQPSVALLPPAVQAVYVQCALKVIAAAATASAKNGESGKESFLKMAASVVDRLHAFAQSPDVEVQERACIVQQLLATLGVPFTPLATPATVAAAKAKAEADLMSLLAEEGEDASGAGATGAAAKTAPASPPPLEPDMRRISAVLSSLFSESLKPVNSKAQRKVPIPEGLDLDAWINPSEESADIEDKRTAFVYNSISFEDSYGVQDDEFAGSGSGRGGKDRDERGGFAGKPFEGGVGNGADEEDDAWFNDMDNKNKRRDKELWGGDDDSDDGKKKSKKNKKNSKDRDEDEGGRSSKGGNNKKQDPGKRDPFMLAKDGGRGRAATTQSDRSDGNDMDSIPIKTLETGALKPSGLDISIFGDFGKKAKSSNGDDGKKGKKSKKSKKNKGDDDDDDDDQPAGGRQIRIMSDESMPDGAGGDDDEKDTDKSIDALANIDLSTPLGDNEVLPTKQHRSVGDPAALRNVGTGGKGQGRARVLGGAGGGDDDSSKKDKKDKKEKKDKKDKKDDDKKDSKKDSKKEEDKKDSKKDSKKEEDKKDNKKDKKDDDKKDSKKSSSSSSAPAAEEKKEKKEKKSSSSAIGAGASGDAPAEDIAAASPVTYPFGADKVIRIAYSVTTVAAAGASPSADGTYSAPTGTSTILFRFEPKSSKKAVEWMDVSFGSGSPLITSGLTAGASSGSYRVAKDLKVKEKDKKLPSKKGMVTVSVTDPYAAVELPVKVTYQVVGGSTATVEGKVVIRAASLLVPVSMEPEAYRGVMMSDGASFLGATGNISFIGTDSEATLNAALGAFRGFAVARSPKHAILYARSTVGAHFTALLKVDDASRAVTCTVKSPIAGHAQRVLNEVTEAVAAAAAEAAKKEED